MSDTLSKSLEEIQESLAQIKVAVRCNDDKHAVRWAKDILNPQTITILLAVLGGPMVSQQLLGGQAIPSSFEEAGSLIDKHLEPEPEAVEEKKEEKKKKEIAE